MFDRTLMAFVPSTDLVQSRAFYLTGIETASTDRFTSDQGLVSPRLACPSPVRMRFIKSGFLSIASSR